MSSYDLYRVRMDAWRRRLKRQLITTKCLHCREKLSPEDLTTGFVICSNCRSEQAHREQLDRTEGERALSDWNEGESHGPEGIRRTPQDARQAQPGDRPW